MITDRFATAILVMILSHLYPEASKACMFLIVLDIVSHWLSMYKCAISRPLISSQTTSLIV